MSTAWWTAQTQRRRAPGGEDGERHPGDLRRIAEGAVADDGGGAAHPGAGHQDGAAVGRAQIATAVEDEDLAGTDRLDRLALGMIGIAKDLFPVEVFAGRDTAKGDRLPDEARLLRVERQDAVEELVAQTALEQLRRDRRGTRLSQQIEHHLIDR